MVGKEGKGIRPLRASGIPIDSRSPPIIVALGLFGRRILLKSRNVMPVLGRLDNDKG